MPPISIPDAILGHGMIAVALPARGTSEAEPTFTFIGFVVDRDTGSPVATADYHFLDAVRRAPQPGDLVVTGVTDLVVELPGDFAGRLLVHADGYRDCDVLFRHHVETGRTMKGLVELAPLAGGFEEALPPRCCHVGAHRSFRLPAKAHSRMNAKKAITRNARPKKEGIASAGGSSDSRPASRATKKGTAARRQRSRQRKQALAASDAVAYRPARHRSSLIQ